MLFCSDGHAGVGFEKSVVGEHVIVDLVDDFRTVSTGNTCLRSHLDQVGICIDKWPRKGDMAFFVCNLVI